VKNISIFLWWEGELVKQLISEKVGVHVRRI